MSDPERLRRRLEAQLPAALDLLRDLVGVNSHTANAEGVNRLGQLTAERFAPLGFHAEFVPPSDPGRGRHLVLSRPGSSTRTVALVSHLDTVFPPDEEARHNFRWLPEGDRIYGPGTIDIKGGTAVMHLVLAALADVDPDTFGAVTWRLFWNASEEAMSDDFSAVCRSRLDPDRTLAALVFEAEGRPRNRPALVVARKGRATFQVRVEGRAAHAGTRHARGANAIRQLARIVERLETLTDPASDLTVNVGVIHGGIAVNRVPHDAMADVELRAFDPAVYRRALEAVRALDGTGDVRSATDGFPCRTRIEGLTEIPAWPENRETRALFETWRETAERLGQELEPERRGGLSDGNWLWDHVPTLDGLGPHGDNDHCSERSADGSKVPEFVHVPSILPKALLNACALQRLVRG